MTSSPSLMLKLSLEEEHAGQNPAVGTRAQPAQGEVFTATCSGSVKAITRQPILCPQMGLRPGQQVETEHDMQVRAVSPRGVDPVGGTSSLPLLAALAITQRLQG
ncbi:uncharacterized protein B0I36DRAFT_116962 [Microdochium trichocladiopsis]|uniref:Uncharacterized protein n=1 Tax=Microdochium trichocladiopsis TaxID=1682393 RepID=A0A9P9BQI7_9PEZI|nr:uncharacterized protein B0I36DRAFT_116962 [Microdochium trichocladiopsis]KAH7030962.1 hypothetical protein B0I36DRAFT_116962 [Microdochium trichocladiopsis]